MSKEGPDMLWMAGYYVSIYQMEPILACDLRRFTLSCELVSHLLYG